MTELERAQQRFAEHFRQRLDDLSQNSDWLHQRRARAWNDFERQGLPTIKHEAWKYTNLSFLGDLPMRPAGSAPNLPLSSLRSLIQNRAGLGRRVVFVDGVFVAELSDEAAPGVRVGMGEAAHADGVRQHLGNAVAHDGHSLAALNTAMFEDAAVVFIDNAASVKEPIHLVFVASGRSPSTVCHPRALVVAGENSKAVLLESFLNVGESEHVTNAVTEVALGNGANLEHLTVQHEGPQAVSLATYGVALSANSTYRGYSLAVGSKLCRRHGVARLHGYGATCVLNGLSLARNSQQVDQFAEVDHVVGDNNSEQLFKTIVADTARSVFDGKVVVRPQAQKSTAYQQNRNLLLDHRATANTKPQLEIYADDVRCSHGATVGQLDDEAVFYLRSRGLALTDARRILASGFANEWSDRIADEGLQRHARSIVDEWMHASALRSGRES